mmetsp:Transcript_5915/g.10651  ORF Transcript_5915/g.10651 Transcript_5915/m.10651 type:complete len:325 (-) Transcript_5915:50-1024(-)
MTHDTPQFSSDDSVDHSIFASCAVSGVTIAEDAKRAAENGCKPLSAGDKGVSLDGTYLAASDSRYDAERPLGGVLRDKVSEQLHKLIEKSMSFWVPGGDSDSTKDAFGHIEDRASSVEQGGENDEAIQLFKSGVKGVTFVSKPAHGDQREPSAASWSRKIKAMTKTHVFYTVTHTETLGQARTIAVSSADIILSAAKHAYAAKQHVVLDTDMETEWRGGVKPGSTIEELGTILSRNTQGVSNVGCEGLNQLSSACMVKGRKRKGKRERMKEKSGIVESDSRDIDELATTEEDLMDAAAKLARKREKRREIKKRRKYSVSQIGSG